MFRKRHPQALPGHAFQEQVLRGNKIALDESLADHIRREYAADFEEILSELREGTPAMQRMDENKRAAYAKLDAVPDIGDKDEWALRLWHESYAQMNLDQGIYQIHSFMHLVNEQIATVKPPIRLSVDEKEALFNDVDFAMHGRKLVDSVIAAHLSGFAEKFQQPIAEAENHMMDYMINMWGRAGEPVLQARLDSVMKRVSAIVESQDRQAISVRLVKEGRLGPLTPMVDAALAKAGGNIDLTPAQCATPVMQNYFTEVAASVLRGEAQVAGLKEMQQRSKDIEITRENTRAMFGGAEQQKLFEGHFRQEVLNNILEHAGQRGR